VHIGTALAAFEQQHTYNWCLQSACRQYLVKTTPEHNHSL